MAPTTSSTLHPPPNPRPIVLSGPSGVGKSTLLKRLMSAHPAVFGFSISHTTRAPRPGEHDGREYHFVTRAAFAALRDAGGFIETAEFGSNLYGTSVAAVADVQREGRVCVLDIEMEGVKQVKKKEAELRARVCFVQPPDVAELERRLRGRGTEEEDAVQKRLMQARNEIEYARTEGKGDMVVVNGDLDTAYKELEGWVLDGGRFGGGE